jgi:N-acetyl-anhydromuramyl-L-alanine amidase AmpD
MSYRFVQAAVDDGRARGPRLALVVHMAQGGGTVEFLSKPNRDGVSVHYVIRYTGEIVQMLDESHMHTSIRTSAIRTTEDPDGFYGRTEVVLAMGTWADTRLTLGPNHASLAVEIEGFAADGPNKAQQDSLERLVTDIRTRFPAIALLGHRDFQDYKACPGHLIPWDRLGGHGKGDMQLTWSRHGSGQARSWTSRPTRRSSTSMARSASRRAVRGLASTARSR